MDINFLDRELMRIMKEEQLYLEQLNNISAYRDMFFKILINIRKGVSRSKKSMIEHNELMDGLLMVDEENARSYKAKVLYHRIKSLYHFSVQDNISFYESSVNLVKALEGNRSFFKEDASEYIAALSNHAVSCGRVGKFNEVREILNVNNAFSIAKF